MHRRLLLSALISLGLAACTSSSNSSANAKRVVVFFTADSAALDENARQAIQQAAVMAKASPLVLVRVLGFAAPNTGSAEFNQVLSQARAQNVADALIAAGVARERVRIQSRGAVAFEQMPVESRRVEIAIDS